MAISWLAAALRIRYTMRGMAGLPSKRDVARALLLKGTVFVHLDPRMESVIVPPWLKRQPQLVLQVGLDMAVPIPDLRVDDAGVYGTLSFNRTSFTCSVPWDAVFAVVGDDGRGMVWPGSMPQEIAAEVEREVSRARASGKDGTIDELPAPQKRSRAPQRRERSKPALAASSPAKKRIKPRPPSLELIAGDGEGGAAPSGTPDRARLAAVKRRDGRVLPSYLRIVK